MRTREECVVCALWTDRRAPQLDSQRLGFLAATVVVVRGERHQWRCGGPISLLADQAREEGRVAGKFFERVC